MPHTECAHRQAQTQISNESPLSSCSALRLIEPMGRFLSKARRYISSKGFTWDAAYTDTSLHFRRGFLLHITISIHSLEFSLGMSTAARFVSLSFRVPPSVTAGLCLRGTCTRRWTPPSSAGPISHNQSKCKCPGGCSRAERTIINTLKPQINIIY